MYKSYYNYMMLRTCLVGGEGVGLCDSEVMSLCFRWGGSC
jgi:hypothetical protein